jgi:hypothetical protein
MVRRGRGEGRILSFLQNITREQEEEQEEKEGEDRRKMENQRRER